LGVKDYKPRTKTAAVNSRTAPTKSLEELLQKPSSMVRGKRQQKTTGQQVATGWIPQQDHLRKEGTAGLTFL
jgi:hypothetical protein